MLEIIKDLSLKELLDQFGPMLRRSQRKPVLLSRQIKSESIPSKRDSIPRY